MSGARSGVAHPNVVDLISEAPDGTVRLIIAETEALTGNHVVALQQKLTNYLAFARDGLASAYPKLAGKPVRIRVDLYAEPDQLVLTFLKRFRVLAQKESRELEVSLFQKDVSLSP